MDIIITFFNEVLYRPLFNILVWLYNVIPGNDLGVAIVILTVIIRFILYPLSKKAIQSQKALNELQPKIKEIQKRHKNKEEAAKAMMDLYKTHKVNPMAGCLPILIQLPLLIALYRVFFNGLNPESLNDLYSFIQAPEALNVMFLGLVNLSERSIFLAFLAGGLQFVHSKMVMPQIKPNKKKSDMPDFATIMSKQMLYMMPLLTVFIAWSLPSALPLYWIVITLFGIIQQYYTKSEIKN